jgi:hypothetical protein
MTESEPRSAHAAATSRIGPARSALLAAYGTLLVVQVAALWILGRGISPAAGFPLDDAWIHQLVARSFVETGTLGAVAGHPLSGATSLLWPLVLSLNHAAVGLPPALFSALVNAILYIVAGQLLLGLLLRDGAELSVAWTLAALAAVAGNHVWFVFSGMEATALIAIFVALALVWTGRRRTVVAALGAGLLLAAAVLVRPEAVVMSGVLALSARWLGWPLKRVILALVPAAATVLGLLLVTLGRGPSTMSGRRWMWLASGQGVDADVLAQDLLARWAERLGRYVLGIPEPDLFWIVCGIAAAGLALTVLKRQKGMIVLCAMHVAHVLVYMALMPAEGHGGRYQPLFPVLFLPLAALGLIELLRGAMARLGPSFVGRAVLPTGVAGVVLGLPAVGALEQWATDHALAVRHINETEVRMGEIVARLPSEARIASYDIGGIGYFGRRSLLDLGALLDPKVLPAIVSGQADALILDRQIDYVVVPMSYSDDFPDPWNFMRRLRLGASKRFRLERVTLTQSPPAVWAPGLEATLHCSPRQQLYRVLR